MLTYRKSTDLPRAIRKNGFTLIEILVVIGIVALLAVIGIAAMSPVLTGAKSAATKATITQLNRMLDEHMQALFSSDKVDKFASTQLKLINGNRIPAELARTIALMHLYRTHFPQNKDDLYGMDGVLDNPNLIWSDSTLLTQMRRANGSFDPASWHEINIESTADSSELMYLVLSQLSGGNTISGLNIDQINPKHIGDTDGDSFPEFLDAWGNPLRFYNWPTRIFADAALSKLLVTGGNQALRDTDPFDTHDLLLSPQFNTLLSSPFQLGPGRTAIALGPENYKDPGQFWAFMIISAGPDGELGLNSPNATGFDRLGTVTSLDELSDNITNRQ